MASDPLGGMKVEPGDGLHVEHDGHVFWFCSAHCQEELTAAPTRFVDPHPMAG